MLNFQVSAADSKTDSQASADDSQASAAQSYFLRPGSYVKTSLTKNVQNCGLGWDQLAGQVSAPTEMSNTHFVRFHRLEISVEAETLAASFSHFL